MLQISQTEKPKFSARIDQNRLRRAMRLPVVFQNVSSSGFHSEIQCAPWRCLDAGLPLASFDNACDVMRSV